MHGLIRSGIFNLFSACCSVFDLLVLHYESVKIQVNAENTSDTLAGTNDKEVLDSEANLPNKSVTLLIEK